MLFAVDDFQGFSNSATPTLELSVSTGIQELPGNNAGAKNEPSITPRIITAAMIKRPNCIHNGSTTVLPYYQLNNSFNSLQCSFRTL